MRKITFLLCIGLLMLSSCSDELTRDKAENILTETFNYPYAEFHQFNVEKNRLQATTPAHVNELAEMGLVDRVPYTSKYGHNYYQSAYSEKAKQYLKPNTTLTTSGYLTGDFAVGTVNIKEVTGIQFNEDKTKATVEYSTYRDNFTPFSNRSSYDEWRSEIKNESVEFSLYDDGWRVNPDEVKGEYLSASEFNFFKPEYEEKQKKIQEAVNTKEEMTKEDFEKYENHPLENIEISGNLDTKPVIIFIEKVKEDSIFGYNILGDNKRPLKGTFSAHKTNVEIYGGATIPQSVYQIELKEPGDDEWDGIFEFELKTSDQGYNGSGTWKAYNGKLNRDLLLTY